MSMLFGPAHQLGYVVRDIEAAMQYWTEKMGIGPFYYLPQAPIMDYRYQGEESSLAISGALAYSGAIQIELIQPLDNAPSSYRAFLDAGHEGLHHIGYLSETYEEHLQRAVAAGLVVEQSGAVFEPAGKFAYFATGSHPGTVMELIALTDSNRQLFRMMEDEAARWDGTNPVRSLM